MAFGGNPNNITIFGYELLYIRCDKFNHYFRESAGGWSVCLHLVAPGSVGLYQQAIIESGPCLTYNSMSNALAQVL